MISQEKTEEKEAIAIVNRGLVFLNNTDFPLVELRMIPGNETEAH